MKCFLISFGIFEIIENKDLENRTNKNLSELRPRISLFLSHLLI